jgi:hypothetical protein
MSARLIISEFLNYKVNNGVLMGCGERNEGQLGGGGQTECVAGGGDGDSLVIECAPWFVHRNFDLSDNSSRELSLNFIIRDRQVCI